MESKAPISPKDLKLGSKQLKETKGQSKQGSDYDATIAEKYAKLFDELDGDLDRIFEELQESSRKAKKHPPKDAEDFGIKYAQGFYTDVDSK